MMHPFNMPKSVSSWKSNLFVYQESWTLHAQNFFVFLQKLTKFRFDLNTSSLSHDVERNFFSCLAWKIEDP